MDAPDGAVVAGHGGDQRRQAADGRAFAVAKLRMETQRREPAAREASGPEVRFGMGAVHRAATPPQAARRFGGVVVARIARSRRSRQGEEGAGLVERRAEGRRVRAMTDEVEQVAVAAFGCVGPLAGDAGTVEADEEGAAPGSVEVARDPVAPLAAAMGEVAAANVFGARAERGGDGGCGRRMVMHDCSFGERNTWTPEGKRAERSEGARPGGLLGTSCMRKGPTREAPAPGLGGEEVEEST